MMGKGTFYDPRLNDAEQFPVAARTGFANVRKTPDLITPKLADLHFYQLALRAAAAAGRQLRRRPPPTRGKALFDGKARCAECHVPPMFSEPGWPMHTAAEIGIDDFQAQRSPDERYRTTPLRRAALAHEGRLLSRRPLRDAAGGGRPLRRALQPRADAPTRRPTSSST